MGIPGRKFNGVMAGLHHQRSQNETRHLKIRKIGRLFKPLGSCRCVTLSGKKASGSRADGNTTGGPRQTRGGSANQSLSHIQPVSRPPKRELEKGRAASR